MRTAEQYKELGPVEDLEITKRSGMHLKPMFPAV